MFENMSFSFDRKLQYTLSGEAPCWFKKKLLMMLTIFQNAEDQDKQNSSYRKLTESSRRFFVLKKKASRRRRFFFLQQTCHRIPVFEFAGFFKIKAVTLCGPRALVLWP